MLGVQLWVWLTLWVQLRGVAYTVNRAAQQFTAPCGLPAILSGQQPRMFLPSRAGARCTARHQRGMSPSPACSSRWAQT